MANLSVEELHQRELALKHQEAQMRINAKIDIKERSEFEGWIKNEISNNPIKLRLSIETCCNKNKNGLYSSKLVQQIWFGWQIRSLFDRNPFGLCRDNNN